MNAVIFDMDGVLVDSEPFWQRAEKEVFTSLGVEMTAALCETTKRMTTREVTTFWYERQPWKEKRFDEIENRVIDRVIELIESSDCAVPGVMELVKSLGARGFKLALATNSPYRIIPRVLHKMNLTKDFELVLSAEDEKKGKPEPDVYLSALAGLKEKAEDCIVIEDSDSGIIAARNAGIKVIAYTSKGKNSLTERADYEITSFENVDYSIFQSRVERSGTVF